MLMNAAEIDFGANSSAAVPPQMNTAASKVSGKHKLKGLSRNNSVENNQNCAKQPRGKLKGGGELQKSGSQASLRNINSLIQAPTNESRNSMPSGGGQIAPGNGYSSIYSPFFNPYLVAAAAVSSSAPVAGANGDFLTNLHHLNNAHQQQPGAMGQQHLQGFPGLLPAHHQPQQQQQQQLMQHHNHMAFQQTQQHQQQQQQQANESQLSSLQQNHSLSQIFHPHHHGHLFQST